MRDRPHCSLLEIRVAFINLYSASPYGAGRWCAHTGIMHQARTAITSPAPVLSQFAPFHPPRGLRLPESHLQCDRDDREGACRIPVDPEMLSQLAAQALES
jgi:hypothetical protein